MKKFLKSFVVQQSICAVFVFCFFFPFTLRAQEKFTVKGKVLDEQKMTLPGVHVYLKSDKKNGIITDLDGGYTLSNVSSGDILVFTFLGMDDQNIQVQTGIKVYDVVMKSSVNTLDETVVTGIMGTRSKATYTGAVATVSGEELKMAGNQNVLQSLRSLDPSFVVFDNLDQGSDPNTMAKVEVRGQTSFSTKIDEFGTDPNQPLFVLDGFVVSLEKINDLDINRILSITILKDAGSTAIYGSKAANGVVVVETIKPIAGDLQVRYSADLSVSFPDLTSYNMMNAEEKLQFELLAGLYNNETYKGNFSQLDLDKVYSNRLAEVRRGVDTYWLSEPVRTGFNNSHSVSVRGGNEGIMYEVGLMYRNNQAVMKKSGRETWSGNVNLNYRKKFINILNQLSVSGVKGENSPYGNFSDWVNTNPYYRKYNSEGEIEKYLDHEDWSIIGRNVINPLYSAQLTRKDETSSFNVINNFRAILDFRNLQVTAELGLNKSISKDISFTPSEDPVFDNTADFYKRGKYQYKETSSFSYNASLMASYAKSVNGHQITLMARGELMEQNNESIGMSVLGFPAGSTGSPAFGHSYPDQGKPPYYTFLNRQANFLGTLNYSYKMRYLVDFTYRLDGSTTFGSSEKFTSFWSGGVGWNIHQEEFMKNIHWLTNFKLRATIGTTGNQNIGGASSSSIYKYYIGSNFFGSGAYLHQFGNPKLEWQQVKKIAAGVDLSILKNRFGLVFDVYRSRTEPCVVNLSMVPSSGVRSYPINLGYLETKGIEAKMSVSPIYLPSQRIIWNITLMGAHTKSVYGNFGNSLESLNEEQRNNKSLEQFVDGYSPSDLWAVRSLGIDPSSGQEALLTADGETTFLYNPIDRVRIGSSRPDIQGNINTSLTFKNLRVSVSFRYSVGGKIFNNALFNKVENISMNSLARNQDKRALYDRWKSPGDMAQYKNIDLRETVVSDMTSRFIQNNNYLVLSSVNASWDFSNDKWLKYIHLKGLKLGVYSNEILRFETSKIERGINYPFARSISLNLTANF